MMIHVLNKIRTPNRKVQFSKALFHTVIMAGTGILLGVVSKLFDIYTTNIGDIFSQMSVWIFLCTLISVLSSTPFRAAVNVFSFCAGMLLAYYLTAELTSSVYSTLFIYGWALFALLCPALSFCTWYAKGKGWLSKSIVAGIILVMLAAAMVLFDKIRVADIVLAVLTSIVLLKK